jgi:hypothetical protein
MAQCRAARWITSQNCSPIFCPNMVFRRLTVLWSGIADMIFPAPMRSECAVLACSGVMVPETNLKLLAQTGWWIPLPISTVWSSRREY